MWQSYLNNQGSELSEAQDSISYPADTKGQNGHQHKVHMDGWGTYGGMEGKASVGECSW